MVIQSGDTTSFDPATAAAQSYKLDKTGLGSYGFNGATPNANAYYDAFMGDTSSTESYLQYNGALTALERSTSIGTIPTGTEGVLEVVFYIYLNGWDLNCFDACKGQSFNVTIIFSTDATDAPAVDDGE